MTGGINAPEFLLLLLIAVVVVGPERLPTYAAQLGRIIRELRKMARGATEKVKEEMGDSFGDLSDLDPRQYDPRRILREALADDVKPQSAAMAQGATMPQRTPRPSSTAAAREAGLAGSVPFDPEAT